MKPNILDFLNAHKVKILPHEVEPYLEFDGEKSSDKYVVIAKSRAVGGTEFCKNVALFDISDNSRNWERVLHSFPTYAIAKHFSHDNLFRQLSVPYSYLNAKFVKSTSNDLMSFEFAQNNRYLCHSITSLADSLRGVSVDFLVRDEIQLFSDDAVEATDASLSAAKHKWCLDVGTPMGKNNHLDKLWQRSDKRKYFYCCVECGEYFHPTMDLLCGIRDVKCPNCDKEQDKMEAARDGKWVAMRNPRGKPHIVGYNFTQLINPLIETVQMMRWREQYPPEVFKAEILGVI
jgi:phage terminase large subunit GpA-like protein